MSAASKGNGNSGCGAVVLGIVVIGVALAVLKAIWWLLLILAAAAAVGAFVYRKKANEKAAGTPEPADPTYTQKCPNCGGMMTVSVYDAIAKCPYCGSSFAAEHEPLSRDKAEAEEKRGLLSDPFKTLIALAAVLAVLGLVGLGYSLSSSDSDEPAAQVSAASPSAQNAMSSTSAGNGAANQSPEEKPLSSNGESAQSNDSASTSKASDNSDDESGEAAPAEPAEPAELNSLQKLFCSLSPATTIEDMDAAIAEDGYSVSTFGMHDDSAYYIGFEYPAVAKRSRDRSGEAIDVSFDDGGNVTSAEYSLHVESGSQDAIKYENGTFILDGKTYPDGESAMQNYLSGWSR